MIVRYRPWIWFTFYYENGTNLLNRASRLLDQLTLPRARRYSGIVFQWLNIHRYDCDRMFWRLTFGDNELSFHSSSIFVSVDLSLHFISLRNSNPMRRFLESAKLVLEQAIKLSTTNTLWQFILIVISISIRRSSTLFKFIYINSDFLNAIDISTWKTRSKLRN